jgi:hypothetical protein
MRENYDEVFLLHEPAMRRTLSKEFQRDYGTVQLLNLQV